MTAGSPPAAERGADRAMIPPAGAARGEKTRFNPFSAEFRSDPYAVYRRLREEDPLHRIMGTWVLTRYRDVRAVLRDRRFSSILFPETVRKNKPNFDDGAGDPISAFVVKAIVFTENPDHARLRQLVEPSFCRARIEHERPMIEGVIAELIDDALTKGGMDGVDEFADLVPLRVTSARIGLPRNIVGDVRGWVHDVRRILDPSLMTKDDYERAHCSLIAFLDVLRGILAQRRAGIGDDLMSELISRRYGDDRLTDDEVLLTCIMSFVAGTETTKYLITNGIFAFLRHPDQLQRLRRKPALMKNVVDEAVRFDAPLQQTKRIALEDVPFAGVTIKEGEQVLLCLGAANRDPEQFPDPDRFDIERADSHAHIGFGYGMRGCVGGAMASLEAEVAFAKLFLGDVDVRLAAASPRWQEESRILRGLSELPLRVAVRTPAAGREIDA